MKGVLITGLLILILLAAIFPNSLVSAARGIPGSPDFGFGAWLHLDGDDFDHAREVASDLGLDWVAVHLDWTRVMPEISSVPDLARLDQIINTCASTGCAVMLSLTNPPPWAMGLEGPDAEISAQFIVWLANRYAPTLQAIEMYPAANTILGWNAPPNPNAYAYLFQHVRKRLVDNGSNLLLVAGGLQPLNEIKGNDWSDVDFLNALYNAGAREWLSILSLRMQSITGEPLQSPANGETFALRRFEIIRQVMVENNHSNGMLWITLINAPGGKINPQDRLNPERQKQAEWLQKAITQIRSHLYIGVVYTHNLNSPGKSNMVFSQDAIILTQSSFHPFYNALKAITQQTKPNSETDRPGRPKSNTLLKFTPKT
jgi:hypothetical protein